MRVRYLPVLLSAALLPVLLWQIPHGAAQTKQAAKRDPAADWPMFLRDLKGTRFSPLKQIDTSNAGKLKQVWHYRFNRDGKPISGLSASELYQEITPIVVNGIMYMPSGDRVVALEPETGKEIWVHEVGDGLASFRGVAYWPGDGNNPPRILFTSGETLRALNAGTGRLDPGFGNEGILPLETAYAGVPTVFKNVILMGTNFYGPGMRHIGPQLDQRGGEIPAQRAYDARTGETLWQFDTFPKDGAVGADTWSDRAQYDRTGNNVWAFSLTVDEERGIVYLPVSGPGANFYGGDRPGMNLFGNSVVALDANTGKYLWHFQTVHHELWDYNLPPAPSLIDIEKDGQVIPALVQVGKSGFMYILNRVTGEPIFGVEEKPVDKSNVPKEESWPTQPIPVKPPPISRVSMSRDDIVRPEDTTPEHSQACLELWDKNGIYNNGPFTTFPHHEEGDNAKPAIIFPGFTGGANWGGTSVDPELGYIFVNTKDAPAVGWMIKNKDYDPADPKGLVEYVRAAPSGLASFSAAGVNADGSRQPSWPCFRPPWGRLIAVNAKTGDFAWEVPLGVTENLPAGKQNTGVTNSAGTMATAGGLVFVGSTSDRRFRVFDSRTGKEVWSVTLPYVATANPMTYQGRDGKQYVAIVAASGGGFGGGAGKGKAKDGPTPIPEHGLYVFSLP